MQSLSTLRPSTLLCLAVLTFAAAPSARAQRGDNRRTDTTPIELPGGSRVEFLQMPSKLLGGNANYTIFFPPSYASSEANRYPVVYFLHGLFNDHTSWTVSRHGDLPALVDTLMANGTVPEMVLVHPDGDRSFYTNFHDGSMPYEDFIVEELPAAIEKMYRVQTGKRHRAIAGTSMGGYGALKIALRFPDRYQAVAAHSPIVFPTANPLDVPAEARASRQYQYLSGIFAEVFGEPFDQAYFDANNPLVLARKATAEGPAIYFDYGTADRYNRQIGLGQGLRMLDRALTESNVPHTFREHQDEPHGWGLVVAHIQESLAFVGAQISQ